MMAGVPFEHQSFPDAEHAMHAADPQRFANTLTKWASTLATHQEQAEPQVDERAPQEGGRS